MSNYANKVIVQPELIIVTEVGQQGPKGAGLETWTIATRPAVPIIGDLGINTDFSGYEMWTVYGWFVMNGIWTFGNRPPEANLAPGSIGYNTEMGSSEQWNGIEWKAK